MHWKRLECPCWTLIVGGNRHRISSVSSQQSSFSAPLIFDGCNAWVHWWTRTTGSDFRDVFCPQSRHGVCSGLDSISEWISSQSIQQRIDWKGNVFRYAKCFWQPLAEASGGIPELFEISFKGAVEGHLFQTPKCINSGLSWIVFSWNLRLIILGRGTRGFTKQWVKVLSQKIFLKTFVGKQATKQ